MFGAEDEVVGGINSGRADKTVVDLSNSKKSKNDKSKIPICTNIQATGKAIFLIPRAKEVFYCLK